jgi:hypothetical protein
MRATLTEKGAFRLVRKDGLEFARVCRFPTGWRVMPLTAKRKPSRKAWPDPESAARSYFGSAAANAVREARGGL